MKLDVFEKLRSSDYEVASRCLDELLEEGEIKENDLIKLLSIDNPLVIGDFLEKYRGFQEEHITIVENYIKRNLDHTNRLFVSDLIEFATIWGLYLPYDKCLGFLEKYGDDDDYVLLASIDYIYENLRLVSIDRIYKLLYSILNNSECNQSAQVKAAFVLFRITNKKEFFTDLMDLLVNGHNNNRLLLSNILSLKHNGILYFEYHDILEVLSISD